MDSHEIDELTIAALGVFSYAPQETFARWRESPGHMQDLADPTKAPSVIPEIVPQLAPLIAGLAAAISSDDVRNLIISVLGSVSGNKITAVVSSPSVTVNLSDAQIEEIVVRVSNKLLDQWLAAQRAKMRE